MREKISLTVLFVVSMATLGIEVLLTRVFSVVLFSSHSFLAISLTLLGSGAGAIIAYLGKKTPEDKEDQVKIYLLAALALAVVISFFVLLHIEFIPRILEDPDTGKVAQDATFNKRSTMLMLHPEMFAMWKLYCVVPIVFLPFLIAGYIQAFIFRHAPKRFSLYYGVDLLAATSGAVTIPLLLYPLGLAGTIATVVLLIVLPAAYLIATRLRDNATAAVAVGPVLIMALLTAFGGFKIRHPAGFAEKHVEREYWTPMARVVLMSEAGAREEMYTIDNTSRTFYAHEDEAEYKKYDRDMYTLPFQMKSGGKALIIASGGGQEVMMADHLGLKDIDAVEIAGPIVRDIMNKKKDDPGNPYLLPTVHPYIADGRSVVKRSTKSYDVIEMLEVNFHTLAGLAAQAWSPYFIFTQEAFAEYLSHLRPDGYLCYSFFSRDTSPTGGDKSCRFRSVIAGMHYEGIDKPEDHFVIFLQPYGYGYRSMVMATKAPLTQEELVQMMRLADTKPGADITVQYPDLRPALAAGLIAEADLKRWQPDAKWLGPVRQMCQRTKPLVGLLANLRNRPSFNNPTNDDRPFMYGSGFRGGKTQQEVMIRGLYVDLLIIMSALAAIFVALPFVVSKGDAGQRVRLDPRLFVILVCTGLGFMFVEMTGMYKYQLYMQHPTIALIVILSGMILGAGLGSLHSGRIPEDKKEAAIPRYAAVSAAGALLLLVLTPIFAHGLLLWLPLEGLLPVAFVAFAALGFFLGHVVPLSIAAYAADQERLLAWCWAITVTGSVFGTVLASIISRDYGMLLIAMLGIACYLVVTLVAGLGLAFGKKAKKAAA